MAGLVLRHIGVGTVRVAATAAVVGAVCVLGGTAVQAGSASSSLSVSATVVNNCTITTAALAFGTYDPVGANTSASLDATGTVSISCTKGAATTIGLGLGSNASGSTRRLSDGASNFLTYEMYQDSGRTTVWGATGGALFTPPAAPSKALRGFAVYGRISGGQDVPAGSYADTVTATVNF
jgi:spore coat protein U-like protein